MVRRRVGDRRRSLATSLIGLELGVSKRIRSAGAGQRLDSEWSNFMKRLTGLDGISLHGETGVMPTHVMAVLFCDSAPRGELTAGAVFRLLAERTAATPAFRQRLLTKPFGLGQPVWVEDPAFDVHKHVHRVRLPKPGTTSELAALIGELHGRRLNRDRALWEAWVVQGLADGRVAVVIKFSHAMSDGVGAVTSILPELMTTDPEHVFPAIPDRAPAAMPGVSAKVYEIIDEIAANTAAGVRITLRVAPAAVESVAENVRGAIRNLLPAVGPHMPDSPKAKGDDDSPRTRLNAPLTARRSVAFAEVAMEDLRVITGAFDVTINDVFLTATTSALRRWLDEHDAIPEGPLRTFMPISTRGADDHASNSWSPTIVKLPVHRADPVAQLADIHATTSRMKTRRRVTRHVDLTDVIDLVPPVAIGLATGLYTGLKLSRWHSPLAHLTTSNVPGPRSHVYCAGVRVLGVHPLAPLCEGANLNITAVSYGGSLAVGLVACPDNVDDVASVGRSIEEVVGELKKAAEQKAGTSTGVACVAPPAPVTKSSAATQFDSCKQRSGDYTRTGPLSEPA